MSSTSGATLELSALTHQDMKLTCNPECTFFRKALCRYTNFANAQIVQSMGTGSSSALLSLSGRSKFSLTLQRTADLMGPAYVRTVLPALNVTRFTTDIGARTVNGNSSLIHDGNVNTYTSAAADTNIIYPAFATPASDGYCYVDAVGLYMVQEATASIGGHKVDHLIAEQQYLEWVSEHPDEKILRYSIGMGSDAERGARAYEDQVIYSPLQFWFTKMSSQYIPLIALQAHDVVIDFIGQESDLLWGARPGGAQEAINATDRAAINAALSSVGHDYVYDGIFLDRAERMMTARMMIEIVATEHSHYSVRATAAGTANINLNSLPLNHPTRSLSIALRRRSRTDSSFVTSTAVRASTLYPFHNKVGGSKTPILWNDFSGGNTGSGDRHGAIDQIQLLLNNHERLGVKSDVGNYYSEVHPSQKFSGSTRDTHAVFYVLGMHGEGQVSGTLNFSAIDNVGLNITRRRNALSSYLPATSATAPGFDKANAEYEAVDIFIDYQHTNVHKYVSGMFGQSYSN